MRVIIIDDTRDAHNIKDAETGDGTYAKYKCVDLFRDAASAIINLKEFQYDIMLLDHDLGNGPSGMKVIDSIKEDPLIKIPKKIRIITGNIIAGPIMLLELQRLYNDNKIQEYSWIKPF